MAILVCVGDELVRVPGPRGADKFVAPRGGALISANAKGFEKGDGWALQHDVGKNLQWTEFKDHGVHSIMKVYGLFDGVFD